MSFPFDATLKEIVREHAADYAAAFGLPRDQPTTVLNVDLSTLSAALTHEQAMTTRAVAKSRGMDLIHHKEECELSKPFE